MSSNIWCVAICRDEDPSPIFVGREDGSIEKYESLTNAELKEPSVVLRGHTKAVTGLYASSADELYSCSLDGTVRIWNVTSEDFTGERVIRTTRLRAPLRCLAFNEGRLYVGGEDGSLNVIDGERQSTWDAHQEALSCIAFTENGLIITGSYDHQVRVFNSSTGQCIRILQGHQNHVKAVTYVEGGEDEEGEPFQLIFSFSTDGTLKVWTVPDPEEPAQDPLFSNLETVQGGAEENQHKAKISFQEPKHTEEEGDDESEQEGFDPVANVIKNPDLHAKSAMKPKQKPLVRRQTALGTIGLPQTPLTVCYDRESENPLLLLGTSGGYILGLHASLFAKNVMEFVTANQAKVTKEVRSAKSTLKKSIALINKEFRKTVRTEQKRQIRAAQKTLKEKKKAERELKRIEREERIAAARAARAERAEGDDEEEEEEDGEFADEEEYDEEGDAGEEEDEEGADPLRILSDAQREELDAFTKREEKKRNDEIEALRAAVAQHLAKVEPLALSTYERPREEFYRLKGTAYTKVGAESVLGVAYLGEKLFCSQGNRILKKSIGIGTTKLN